MTDDTRDQVPSNRGEDGSQADVQTPLLQKAAQPVSSMRETVGTALADDFLWELISAAFAVVSFAAIVIVLVVFDGSALPDWPAIFTINSIVSFFTVLSKLSLMSIVGASISQSKWLWYRQEPRPLQDIQGFDDASRGPWGATNLLVTLNTRTFASLGSMVIVLSLLFGPFTQQAVSYRDELVQAGDKDASIVRAQQYLAPSYEGLSLPSIVDLSMKAAIYQGFFDASNQANSHTEHHCSTGNCTFDHFASLAVGSKCVNVTHHVEKSCNATGCTHFLLHGGPSIALETGQINASVTSISSSLEDVEASIVQFSALYSQEHNHTLVPQAWECALYFCVNEYSAAVQNGDLAQTVHRQWRNDSASLAQNGSLIYNPPASAINITANSSSFNVDNLAARALNSFLSDSLTGSGGVKDTQSGEVFSSDIIHALYEANHIPTRIDNLAVSMSNNIRQQNNSGSNPFEGKAFKSQTHLSVRWPWLAYPIALLIMSCIYLSIVILQSRNGKVLVWKASTIAVLFHGQHLEFGPDNFTSVDTVSEMGGKASEVKVRLRQNHNAKWRLVQD